MSESTINAWHFSNGTLTHGDGRKIHAGMALACKPEEIGLCDYGFHASEWLIDALMLGSGSGLSYVECGGRIIHCVDKLVCSQRRHLIVVDISVVLHEFAYWCAERALALVKNPDPRIIAAIKAKRDWLDGKIDDGQLEKVCVAAFNSADATYRDDRASSNASRASDAVFVAYAAANAARANAFRAVCATVNCIAIYAADYVTQNKQLTAMVMRLPEFAHLKEQTNHD